MSKQLRPLSKQAYENLCKLIPGGVNSPVRAFKAIDQLPLVASHGKGDLLYDLDGHSYIDYCMSWGASIHGHAHPEIVSAAIQRTGLGSSFGMTTAVEGELAHKIVSCMPSIQKIRFVSTGTEATMSAIRLARGFTKRQILIKFIGNYHGHADFLLVKAGSGVTEIPESTSAGIPHDIVRYTYCLPYNDSEAFTKITSNPEVADQIAAVIVEPIAGNMGVVPATPEFLTTLRKETARIGALLIFDEVISGFRVGLQGAQGQYQITPDLTCLGKIIGGGFPAAAFGGRAEIMDLLAPLGSVYQAGTLSGNPVAMVSGSKAIEMLERGQIYDELKQKVQVIIRPIQELIEKRDLNCCVQHAGSMFTIFFGLKNVSNMEQAERLNLAQFKRFFRFLFDRGILIPPSQYEACFVSTVHEMKHLEKTRDVIIEFLNEI